MPHNTLEIGFINSSNLDELEKYINDTNQIKNYNKIINFTEHIDNITDDLITDKPIITSSDKLYEQLKNSVGKPEKTNNVTLYCTLLTAYYNNKHLLMVYNIKNKQNESIKL